MIVEKLAAQFYTLREFTKTAQGFEEALGVVHGIGYAGVQLSAVGCMNSGSPEVDAAKAREMLDSNGLKCVATHRPWTALRDHTDEEIEFHKTLGCDYVAVGYIADVYGFEPDGYRKFLADSKPVIAKLRDAGIRFGYHNHDFEFMRNPATSRPCYDILIDEGGPELTLEIDTYWVQHAGLDPVRLLERCSGRIPVIHVKDKEVLKEKGPVMAPVGEGNLDWPEIIRVCEAGGTEWYIVEQDECQRDPFDCLASSYDYLASLRS